jgi:glycosyltransferase involved in cell wall biosynthesis
VISVVIPVYNSAPLVGDTVARVVRTCERHGWTFEVVLVNDASTDGSAEVLRDSAARHAMVRVLHLPRNGGQHAALLEALRAASGDIVVCLDDDGQHAPEALPALVAKAAEGHDAVYARFQQPRHPVWRRPGSALVRALDRQVFGAPAGLAVSSYRLLRRDVVNRVIAYRGHAPYIRGQMLLASHLPAHVDVEHRPRALGRSSYTRTALVAFVLRVLCEWSRVPAWSAVVAGVALSTLAVAAMLLTDRASVGADATRHAAWVRLLAPILLTHGVVLLAMGGFGLRRPLPQERRATGVEPRRDLTHLRR